jgi:hypothetical protein
MGGPRGAIRTKLELVGGYIPTPLRCHIVTFEGLSLFGRVPYPRRT